MSAIDVDSTAEGLEAAIARAVTHRVHVHGEPGAPSLGEVRRGARRRIARRRAGIGGSLALLVGAAIALGVTHRSHEVVPSGTEDQSRPPSNALLPGYAVLGDVAVPPLSMLTSSGGETTGIRRPAVDVWRSGDETLIIRTMTPDEHVPVGLAGDPSSPVTAAPAASNAPWYDTAVEPLVIRGDDNAIKQLAPDQFAVWIRGESVERYTLVIARGMSRERTIEVVEALSVERGVLRPTGEFTVIEHVPALPRSRDRRPFAVVNYRLDDSVVTVRTGGVGIDEDSFEAMTATTVGRLETVGTRDVVIEDFEQGSSAVWLEPDGSVVGLLVDKSTDIAQLVGRVRMVSQADFAALGREASLANVELPGQAQARVGDVELSRRGNDETMALCLRADSGGEACAAGLKEFGSDRGLTLQATIGGTWYLASWRAQADLYAGDFDAVAFAAENGRQARVDWVVVDNELWLVAAFDDAGPPDAPAEGLDQLTSNVAEVIGGSQGPIHRSLVTSAF